jgi:hypothetical protein
MFATICKITLHHNPKTTLHILTIMKTSELMSRMNIFMGCWEKQEWKEKENRKWVPLNKTVISVHI